MSPHRPGPLRPVAGMITVAAALLLGACSGGPPLTGPENTGPAEILTSDSANQGSLTPGPAPAPTGPSTTGTAQSGTSPSTTASASTAPSTCDASGTDLSGTDFGRFTATTLLPVTFSRDTFYSFTVRDNAFDPCAELSYAVLEGSLGDINGRGGTGSSVGDAVVFFHGAQLISDPLPFMTTSVESVDRLDGGTLEVTHGHLGGATAEGVTGTFRSRHTFEAGRLDSDLSGFPAELSQNLTRLDVTAPAVTPEAPTTVIHQTLAAGRYRLPINRNQNLLCDIGHAGGPVADCYADFPTTWKMHSDPHPQATRIIYTEDPPHARGTADPTPSGTNAQAYSPVQGENTLAVGEALVDLSQPNQVIIGTEKGGLLITPDSYEVLDPTQLTLTPAP